MLEKWHHLSPTPTSDCQSSSLQLPDKCLFPPIERGKTAVAGLCVRVCWNAAGGVGRKFRRLASGSGTGREEPAPADRLVGLRSRNITKVGELCERENLAFLDHISHARRSTERAANEPSMCTASRDLHQV